VRRTIQAETIYIESARATLVDYGHNADGFAAVCRMARRWNKTVTAIIGLPGDRDNDNRNSGVRAPSARFWNLLVEEINPRGRALGEMVAKLFMMRLRDKPPAAAKLPDERVFFF